MKLSGISARLRGPGAAETAPADHPDTVPATAGEILAVAMDLGVEMLRVGAEVHRVEDTITRVCRAYGAVGVDVFAISSLIIGEIRLADGDCASRTRRVGTIYQHLGRMDALNSLSRAICASPKTTKEVYDALARIHGYRPIPEWLCYVGGMVVMGSFAIFFGGTWRDGIAALLVGLLIMLFSRVRTIRIHPMLHKVISSFVAGVASVMMVRLGIGEHIDKIMIGTIMLEIPGISFGNALRDLLCGETLSGTTGFVQTLLQALMMALGYMAAFGLLGV